MIKHNFLNSVILKHPNFDQPFFMNCDASDVSLGSVLYQDDSEGNHQVVSFASRILNGCEPVSYTHLDVYKRQPFNRDPIVRPCKKVKELISS